MCSYRAEENQNHWMVRLGKELKIVQLQAPWHSKGHLSLEQVAQSPIQPGFEHFLGEASTAINISKLGGKKVMPDSFRGQNKDCCVETKIQKVPPQSLQWGWQGTGKGCPRRSCCPPLWRCSKSTWVHSCVNWSKPTICPLLQQGSWTRLFLEVPSINNSFVIPCSRRPVPVPYHSNSKNFLLISHLKLFTFTLK